MFNCTARGVPIRWSVFTPNINYTNLEIITDIQESVDGVIMADLIAVDRSTMPITVVSSLTANVTAELEGSKVQCLGLTANGQDTEIKLGFIHITGDYLLIRYYFASVEMKNSKEVVCLWQISYIVSPGQMREIHSLKPL